MPPATVATHLGHGAYNDWQSLSYLLQGAVSEYPQTFAGTLEHPWQSGVSHGWLAHAPASQEFDAAIGAIYKLHR
jgi:hypothetical protein